MYCKRCSGNIYVDKPTVDGTRFDMACLTCGYRVFANAKTNSFARFIYKHYQLGLSAHADGGDVAGVYKP